MKKALITGASGFIGTYMTRTLVEKGYEVTALVYGDPADFGPEVKVCEPDITDDAEMAALMETLSPVDVVIHLAALLTMDSNDTIRVNEVGTANVIRLANALGARQFVYLSSIPVIGKPVKVPVTEEHPVDPGTLYHITKYAGEQMLPVLCRPEMKKLIFRISSPVGVGMRQNNYLSFLIRQCREEKEIELYGQGQRTQNYIDVRDIADGIFAGIQKEAEGLFLLAGERSVTNRDLAFMVRKLTGASSDIVWGRREDPEEKNQWIINTDRIRNRLGFTPGYTLEDTVSWILNSI